MRFIVPIHVIDYTGAPGGVQAGFKKFYLKNGYFKLFDGTIISDVVLDRPLDNFTPLPGIITANDTVLTALEKLQSAVASVTAVTITDVTADLTVGGIAAQQVIPAGTDLQQFVQDLLTKVFNPTINPPSFSLSYPAAIREIGSSAPITLTFNFDRGGIVGNTVSGIWQPGAVQGFRAGASSSYTIDGVTQPSNTLLVSPVLLPGGNPFNGTVTYGVGIQPKDSKGNDYLTPLAGGTSPTQSTTVQGIYPYFYYKSFSPITAASMQTAIASGAATKVLGDSTGTLAIPYNVSGQYMSVAYPNASTAKTKYFVSLFDQGALSDPTSPFNLGTVLPCNSIDSFWSNISYRIHVSPILTNPGAIIELRNS